MATIITSNTGRTKSTDRTAGGSKPDSTPATGSTTTGGGGGAVNSVTGSLGVGASPTTGNVSVYLNPTGVSAATYGDATHVPQIAVNAQGQITSASNVAITSSSGVTRVDSGTGLTGGPITTSGTLSIANTSVAAGSYGTASSVPTIAINAQGQITSASNTSIAISGSAVSGNISGNAANVTGVVGITNGGTGATSASAARTNLGAGTVSSVATSGSVNGITLTGGPITTSGTVTLGGTLSGISNSQLTNSAVTINTGTGLSGGGTVSLGGSLTLTNTVSGLPSSASPGQVLLQGASTAGWYNHAYNVTAFASLSAAITAAGSNGVLYFPTAYTIPNGTTISLPIIVEGLLTCSGTATFNGTIQAPLKQIFSGGTVTIGYNNSYIYPEWFGARTGGNDYTAMVAAINSITPDTTGSTSLRTSAPIQSIVLSGTYQIGSTITITNGAIFKVIGGATFIPYGSFTGDCIVYQYYTWNLSTDIPTIIGFTGGTGLTLFGCNVLKATGYMIKLCQTAIKFRASSGHNLLDNYVNIHFIPDNQIGVLFTDDGTACTIQGNEVYSNFYTNDNLSTPWAVATSDPNFSTTGYQANNICGVLFDNKDNTNWDGNIVKIEAIDINSASNSYCFHNSSNTYLSNWRIECPSWLGGLNYPYWTTQSFITGNFTACTFRFRISAELIDYTDSHGIFHYGIIWGTMNIKGFENRIVYINGGGHYNTDSTAGQPTSAYGVSTTSGRSSFSPNPPLKNRLTCKYNITSSIPANGLLTLYAYVPITDAFTSGTTVAASNNFYAVPYPNSTGGTPVGLVFESAFDNSANVANEVILFFRNVSGGTINSGSGFFDFILTVGL